MKIVRAIRKGWIVPGAPKVPSKPPVYMLWNDTDEVAADHVMNIPAPKVAPPEHAESYNPPAEYLPTDQERKEWESMDPEDRPRNFLPQKYGSLRKVPAYTRLMNERFERCLDLYLCPRVRKQKIQMDPEALLPKLPDARDLQPFPMQEAVKYAHGSRVRSISCDASGRWLVSGGDGGVVKLWEVSTGRCWKTWDVEGVVHCVAWSPGRGVEVFAVAVWVFWIIGTDQIGFSDNHDTHSDNSVLLITPGLENEEIKAATESLFRVDAAAADDKTGVVWGKPSSQEEQTGIRAVLKFPRKVTNVVWHRKGDYFATLTPDAPNSPIAVHQLSKRHSQNPFRKSKGTVQKMLFHPGKPFLFVAVSINSVHFFRDVERS
jgi:ribosome biogenesis protein ERB1